MCVAKWKEGAITWGGVTGPINATIGTLLGLQWNVGNFLKWVSPRGNAFNVVKAQRVGGRMLIAEVKRWAEDAGWLKAAEQVMGAGLEHGAPILAPARKARAQLLKEGLHEHVKALDMIVSGRIWNGASSLRCSCGAPDTPWHRYWDRACPRLRDSDVPFIKSTNALADKFYEKGSAGWECLWARAMPREILEKGKAPEIPAEAWQVGDYDSVLAQATGLYTDGSGGSGWLPKSCAYVGAGLSAIVSEAREAPHAPRLLQVAMAGQGVPGRQTVPRAELHALNVVTARAKDHEARIGVDASYVVSGRKQMAGGQGAGLLGGYNCDLWERQQDLKRERQHHPNVRKVKAHCSADVLVANPDVDVLDIIGNLLADAGAGEAAHRVAWENGRGLKALRQWEADTVLIAKRLAAIEVHRWSQGPTLVPPLLPLPECVEVVPLEAVNHAKAQEQLNGQKLFRAMGTVRCAWCRKCAKGEADWARKRCPNARSIPIEEELGVLSLPKMPRITNDEHARPVTVAVKKQAVKAQRQEIGNRQAILRSTVKEGQRVAGLGTVNAFINAPAAEPALPPYPVGQMHALICCGGFVGCVKCGGVMGSQASKILAADCRLGCPAGSRGPISRLCRGQLPHQHDGGPAEVWPSGELEPVVRQFVVQPQVVQTAPAGTPADPSQWAAPETAAPRLKGRPVFKYA